MADDSTSAKEPRSAMLELHEIEKDTATQCRVTIDEDKAEEYGQAMKDGTKFPPVVVFYDGARYWLADGWHRFHAAEWAGRKSIAAEVRRGTKRDAVWHALGANARHGLPLTNTDKRRAVAIALADDEWAAMSDREIAQHCGCSKTTVIRVRQQLTAESVPNNQGGTILVQRTKAEPSSPNGTQPASPAPPPLESFDDAGDEDDEDDDEDPLLADHAELYRRLQARWQEDIKAIRAEAEDPERGGRLRLSATRFVTELQSLRNALRQLEPVELCPRCDGEGCDHCLQTGTLSRGDVNRLAEAA